MRKGGLSSAASQLADANNQKQGSYEKMDNILFSRFRSVLTASLPPCVRDPRLVLEQDGRVSIYYAPFEHINHKARIALVGITPGPTQMNKANNTAREALLAGRPDLDTMKAAKQTASFSGEPMRSNLIRQMNHWGIHQWLGISDSSLLFSDARDLVHTTSLLRFPVFVGGKDYRGSPDMTKNSFLKDHLMAHFVKEVEELKNTMFFGLGPKVQSVLDFLTTAGTLPEDRVIPGMLHPSGNNTYRINYLTGARTGPVPHATTPGPYDTGRARFHRNYLSG